MTNDGLNRRRFLLLGAALAVAGPAACAEQTDVAPDLDEFLHLSSLLTGFAASDLDRTLGQTYLDTLNRALIAPFTLAHLYEQAGLRSKTPPKTFEELERTGIFDRQPAKSALEEIMTSWYSGTVPVVGTHRIRVATYDAALSWKAITWTSPNMECRGALGFWSDPPSPGVT